MGSYRLKIRFPDGEVRRIALSSPVFTELSARIVDLAATSSLGRDSPFKVSYVDAEGDAIVISTDVELREAFTSLEASNKDALVVVVAEVQNHATQERQRGSSFC